MSRTNNTRSPRIEVRCTEEQKANIVKAARDKGVSVSQAVLDRFFRLESPSQIESLTEQIMEKDKEIAELRELLDTATSPV